jgi:CheY-like chemotaxis protein
MHRDLMSQRTRILLVTDSELLAYAMTSALIDRAEISFVLTPGEALARVARGECFDLILSSLELRGSLALHAAISRRNAMLAGRMLIFDRRQVRQVIEMATELDVGERSYQKGSGRVAGGAV